MTQRIEFTNTPPTVAQCPKLELRLLARGLVEATRNYKLHTKENFFWNGYCRMGIGFGAWKHMLRAVNSSSAVTNADALA